MFTAEEGLDWRAARHGKDNVLSQDCLRLGKETKRWRVISWCYTCATIKMPRHQLWPMGGYWWPAFTERSERRRERKVFHVRSGTPVKGFTGAWRIRWVTQEPIVDLYRHHSRKSSSRVLHSGYCTTWSWSECTRMLPHPVRGRRVYQDWCQRVHPEIFQRRTFGRKVVERAVLKRNPTRPYNKSFKHSSSMPPLWRLARKISRKQNSALPWNSWVRAEKV